MKLIDNSGQTNWKFIAIVVVIAVFVGAGVIFYASQSDKPLLSSPQISNQPETANWKTYTNSEFFFTIQYPQTYKLTEPYKKSGNRPPSQGEHLLQIESNSPKKSMVQITGQASSFYPVNYGLIKVYTPNL